MHFLKVTIREGVCGLGEDAILVTKMLLHAGQHGLESGQHLLLGRVGRETGFHEGRVCVALDAVTEVDGVVLILLEDRDGGNDVAVRGAGYEQLRVVPVSH